MKHSKKILFIILIIGAFLRLIRLGQSPASIYWDEASIGYEAFSISQTGKDMHGNHWLQAIFPAYGDYKAPVYIWFTSLFIKIFGPTIPAIRYTSAIFGSLSILAFYILSKQILNTEKTSLISSFLFALLPSHIHFSRVGFESNLAVFFILIFLILIKKAEKNNKYIFLSTIPAIISIYTYFSARIIIPLIYLLWLTINVKNIKKLLIPSLVFGVVFFIGLLPMLKSPHYQASNQIRFSTDSILDQHDQVVYSNQLRQADNNSLISRVIHHRYLYITKEFFQNIFDHLDSNYLFFTGDTNPRHSSGVSGVILPISIVLFILGLFQIAKDWKTLVYILGTWFIFLIPASVPQTTPHLLRSLGSIIPISLILAFGAEKLIALSKKSKSLKIFCSIFLVMFVINFSYYYYHLQFIYPEQSSYYWQDGYPQLGKYLKENYSHYDYFIITPGDRLFLYALYFTKMDPATIQNHQAKSLATNPNQFALTDFEKISFKPLIAEDILTYPTRALVVYDPGSVPEYLNIKDNIKNIKGETVFSVVHIGSQPL